MNVGRALARKGVRESGSREREGREGVWPEYITYVYAVVDYKNVNRKNKFKEMTQSNTLRTRSSWPQQVCVWNGRPGLGQTRCWCSSYRSGLGMGNNSESTRFCQDSFSCACWERLSASSMIALPTAPLDDLHRKQSNKEGKKTEMQDRARVLILSLNVAMPEPTLASGSPVISLKVV